MKFILRILVTALITAVAESIAAADSGNADAREIGRDRIPPPDPWSRPLDWFCFHGWIVCIPAVLIVAGVIVWCWRLRSVARKRANALDGLDADYRELS